MNRGISGLIWAAAASGFLFATACNDTTGGDGGPGAICASTADCGGAQFCSGGTCQSKILVGSCADATDHKAAEACQTGICLGGACCNSTCAARDPLCKAASCDAASGACQYPAATVSCGPAESCANGSHTAASSCDGHGACALSAPKACDSLACNGDGKTCLPGCHDNSTCGTGNYCAWGQCVPQLQPGATCGQTTTSPAGSACSGPGLCLGTFCCATACDTTDVQCGATSCDSSGACVYPDQKTTCGALQACSGETYTPQSACNGTGACVTSAPVTCEPYICNEPVAICYATCTADGGQCAVDGFCKSQKCALKESPGLACAATPTSSADQACKSGICSVNCCLADCPADPTTYNCKGACDNAGGCIPKTCPNNFGCSGTIDCNTQCATNADCYAQAFCDPAGLTACCSKYSSTDTIYVDGKNGDDTSPCCGAQATPCQTLTHAMALVANSATSGVTIQALNGDSSTGWTANETYPIHLGWGVTLSAANIHFSNPTKASEIFQVYSFDPVNDTGAVSIKGGGNGITTDGVLIGFDPNFAGPPFYNYNKAYIQSKVAVNAAVAGKTGVPLVLSGVWMNGNDGSGTSYGLKVGAGVAVTLGPDQVEIGNGSLIGASNPSCGTPCYYPYGYTGIYCKGAGASITDDATATSTVLTVEQQQTTFMDIEDGCTVSLTQGPLLGNTGYKNPSNWDGDPATCTAYCDCYTECSTFANTAAVQVVGSGSVTFGSAAMPGAIKCAKTGFDAETSNKSGSPTVKVQGVNIDLSYDKFCYTYPCGSGCSIYGQACAGAMITEGTFSASSSTFSNAFLGVFVGSNAVSADLSGGGNGGNTFGCNSSSYGQQYYCGNNSNIVPSSGADVVNATAAVGINAENATWDLYDSTANSTQVWTCSDTTYSDCTCTGASCPGYSGYPPGDADAIYLTTNTAATPLDTTAGSANSSGTCQ